MTILFLVLASFVSSDFLGDSHQHQDLVGGSHQHQLVRQARQEDAVPGGVDFSSCVQDRETGFCCVEKEETVTSVEKEPILECTHKNTEQCHYTYVTQFKPSQEEVCEENFEKSCQITFKQQAYNETVRKCYRPVEKVCSGQGPEVCRTVYEASCSTKYVGVSQKQYKNSQLIFSDMLRSCQVSSCLTLSVRSCLWRSAELDVPLRRDRRNAITR